MMHQTVFGQHKILTGVHAAGISGNLLLPQYPRH
jgi:hypothetical protein